jgi:hypothetical protein
MIGLLLFRFEIRPHVGATMAAGLANETRLNIRQPHVVGPSVGAERDRVVHVIRAINQDAAHAHVAEGDFLRPIHRRSTRFCEPLPQLVDQDRQKPSQQHACAARQVSVRGPLPMDIRGDDREDY